MDGRFRRLLDDVAGGRRLNPATRSGLRPAMIYLA